MEENKNKALNLDLSETARTKVWVNGDCTKILELNLTDLGIMGRAQDAIVKLDELQAEANKLASAEVPDSFETKEDERKFSETVKLFRDIDKKMRVIVNGIFDFNVCDVCCDGGSMYDPIGGKYRYEYIIEKLMNLYGQSWERETKIAKDRMKSHTAKYTKKRTVKK